MLKFTLNLEEDEKLRNEVYKIVQGQIRAIVREEIYKVLTEECSKKITTDMIRYGVSQAINQYLYREASTHIEDMKKEIKEKLTDRVLAAIPSTLLQEMTKDILRKYASSVLAKIGE